MCIPSRIFLSFNNDKPWFTGKLKQLHQAKEDAYRSGDKILYNQMRNRLTKEIRVTKNNHSEKLKKKILSANELPSVWTGLRNITKYKTPPPQSVENQKSQCILLTILLTFRAASNAPSSFPSPKSPKSLALMTRDTLTFVVMKSLERLVLAYLKDITRPLLNPLQFAYRANRSVGDTVNMGLHYNLQHLDKPGIYARILFVDFSSPAYAGVHALCLFTCIQLHYTSSWKHHDPLRLHPTW